MGIIATDEWLLEEYDTPELLCERMRGTVPLPPSHIYRFLAGRGMYRPVPGGKEEIKELQTRGVWRRLRREYAALRSWLRGPDIPVYIFPSDVYNKRLQRDYRGKGGLAFAGCLFLFISPRNTLDELCAVLTHEYHHVCRLQRLGKDESDYTLLDSMVMEGLAEAAVRERHGADLHAEWVSYYKKEEVLRYWHSNVEQLQDTARGTRKHDQVLNGTHIYPHLLGYAIGFFIVEEYMKEQSASTRQALAKPAAEILRHAPSFSKLRP